MKLFKWILVVALVLGLIATIIMFIVEASILGFPAAISQVFGDVRIILRSPVFLVPILLIMGIPFALLTVRGGDIAGAHMERILMGVCLLFAAALLLAPFGVWRIAAGTMTHGPYILLESGNYDRALAHFESLQAREPADLKPLRYAYEIATCHYGKRDYAQAITLCDAALGDEIDRSSDQAQWYYLLMGDCYVALGNLVDAKKCYGSCPMFIHDAERRIQDITKDPSQGGSVRGSDIRRLNL